MGGGGGLGKNDGGSSATAKRMERWGEMME
jgi:hypothetical protein